MSKPETRRVILDAALVLFTELGFHGTSTAAIARRAGVATGTLFHHFASKTDLINALYLDAKTRFREGLAAGFDVDQGVRGQFRTLMVGCLRWALDHRDEYRFFLLFHESPNITVEARSQGLNDLAPVLGVFERGRREGVFRDLPVELLRDLTWRVTQALIDHVVGRPELVDDPAFLDRAFATLWDTVRRSES